MQQDVRDRFDPCLFTGFVRWAKSSGWPVVHKDDALVEKVCNRSALAPEARPALAIDFEAARLYDLRALCSKRGRSVRAPTMRLVEILRGVWPSARLLFA